MTRVEDDREVVVPVRRHPHLGRQLVGGFYLVMGGVHLGLVSADTEVYRTFADAALFGFVRDGWAEVVMPHMAVWGLLLMAGEITLGTLLLAGGRAAPWGWAGVIVFHLLLMLFGFWAWAWAVPALVVLVLLARHDLRVAAEEAATTDTNRKHDMEEVAA
jgi:hypothetical protein